MQGGAAGQACMCVTAETGGGGGKLHRTPQQMAGVGKALVLQRQGGKLPRQQERQTVRGAGFTGL